MSDTINSLMEELIYLDELAMIVRECAPEQMTKIDARRVVLKKEILELESLGSRWA